MITRPAGADPECLAAMALSFLPHPSVGEIVEEVNRAGSAREALRRLDRAKIGESLERAEREVRSCEAFGFSLLWLTSRRYPEILRQIADPPLVLYLWGSLVTADEIALAMVGARRATAYGIRICEQLATDLARRGVSLVSGLARGIDGAAHRAALAAKGRTLAVLGSGLDRIYPREHRELAEHIVRSGAVLSEFPLGSPPLAHHFPRRNRVVSGLALGTIVVEAAERSGSLISAGHALEQNREVFAVPGAIGSPTSKGVHRLIQRGEAKLITCAEDIIEELGPEIRSRLAGKARRPGIPAPCLSEDELLVFDRLRSVETMDVDELVSALRIPAERVTAALVGLELKGQARQFPGCRYAASPRGE